MINVLESPFASASSTTGFDRGDVIWVDHLDVTGRLRCAYPVIVAADADDLVALYVPHRSTFLGPVNADGDITRDVMAEAGVGPTQWNDHAALHLVPAGASYTAMARWGAGWDDFRGWHVSFQRPLERTATGFITCDFTLDIEVFADFSWAYKDEDEYHEMAEADIVGAADQALVDAGAADALGRLEARAEPFASDVASWRPAPEWTSARTDAALEIRRPAELISQRAGGRS